MLLHEDEHRVHPLDMDSKTSDWILQCLKTKMDNAKAATCKTPQSPDHSDPEDLLTTGQYTKRADACSSQQAPPLGGRSSPAVSQASSSSSSSLCFSNSPRSSTAVDPSGQELLDPTTTLDKQHHRIPASITTAVPAVAASLIPTDHAVPNTSVGVASPRGLQVSPCGNQTEARDASGRRSGGPTEDPISAPTEEGAARGDDGVGLSSMKQERGESPSSEASNFSKALNAASTSVLANTLFSLNRLRGAGLGGSSSSVDASDWSKQQLATMLQNLPFIIPGLQRLSTPAGLPVPGGGSGSSLSAAGSLLSTGIQCVCGIRFSSRGNMEAHRTFYCTHHSNAGAELTSDSSSSGRDTTEGVDEATWSGLLRCPQCPYTTTHKLSLNGHMNMHTTPHEEAPAATPPKAKPTAIGVDARAAERYCTDCDIQFSSLKTFKVHKAHYCRTRHVLKGNKSPVREDPTAAAAAAAAAAASLMNSNVSAQPILLLPTDPVLLVPYSVLVGASLLPSHILPQQGAAVLTPDGHIQPLSLAHFLGNTTASVAPPLLSPNFSVSATVPPVSMSSSSASPQISPRNITNTETTRKVVREEPQSGSAESAGSVKRRGEGDSPLDLTTKRSKLSIKSNLLSDDEKENREVNTPSLSNSPVTARHVSSNGSLSGEFEGKLLATSPRASPSTEEGNRSTPRSPRPASAAPSLSSPRGAAQDSPRASTSAANRSPSQTSPALPQPMMPQISTGFPSFLGGLDSINSLPFASLQYLQSLQGVAPDLLLKMFNGIVPPVPPSPSTPIKQGEARCNECNIIFYKEENYLVHKKHYCAAREKRSDEERQPMGQRSPVVSRGSVSPPSRSVKSELPPPVNIAARDVVPKSVKPHGQFVCNPCGIKFTSPDNLTAHQTYYCPKREGLNSDDAITKGMWKCPRCRVAMPDSLQAKHQCVSLGSSSAHGWKCPCCPMLSPTAAAAQKHLESHAGIKAFRCTICGYRGNTLRGMRTHIRMHFDKRTNELQEENFIECILEDDDRRSRMSNSQEMRMNLSEHQQALLENPTLAAAIFSSGGALVSDKGEPPISCTICPFVTTSRDSFIKHVGLIHKLGIDLKSIMDDQSAQMTSKSPKEKDSTQINGVVASCGSPPPTSVKLEPEVKLEFPDSEEDIHMRSNSKSPIDNGTKETRKSSPVSRSVSRSPESVAGACATAATSSSLPSTSAASEPAPHHCHVCNISFAFLDSYLAHKRFYCTRQQSNTPPETTVK